MFHHAVTYLDCAWAWHGRFVDIDVEAAVHLEVFTHHLDPIQVGYAEAVLQGRQWVSRISDERVDSARCLQFSDS